MARSAAAIGRLVLRILPLAMVAGPAGAAGLSITVDDPAEPETVFRWATDACAPDDIPDVPARAFRDALGTVHLIASHTATRAMTGPDLDRVRRDCRVILDSARRDDPALFDDFSWVASTYTPDGATVYGLVHMEYQGHRRPALCPSGGYLDCWSNAITWAVSTDGGHSFSRPPPPAHLVAALPYRYRGDIGYNVGLFGPSNIIARDGHYYSLIFAGRHRDQAHGNCLIRTDRLDDPRSWRAWDGHGFTTRFINPYRDVTTDPAAHTCVPVAPDRLTGSVNSVVLHRPSGLYVAVMTGHRAPAPGAERVAGIYAATSPDLIEWSQPALVLAAPTLHHHDCADDHFLFYPSILDPDSPSRNFSDTDGTAYLYVTRLNQRDCRVGWNRDLIRMPVVIADGDPAGD